MFYFPLRKFWHCERDGGQLEGHHLACEANMLFDLRYDGCNYAELTDCGERYNYINIIKTTKNLLVLKFVLLNLDRPICGPCDTECSTQPPPTTPVSNQLYLAQ